MNDRALKATGAAHSGDGDAGMDARGRAMHGAIADAGMDARGRAMQGAIAEDAARAARVRRNAWLLAGCAVLVYVGYIAWMFFRAQGG